jgi:hypothetical protein
LRGYLAVGSGLPAVARPSRGRRSVSGCLIGAVGSVIACAPTAAGGGSCRNTSWLLRPLAPVLRAAPRGTSARFRSGMALALTSCRCLSSAATSDSHPARRLDLSEVWPCVPWPSHYKKTPDLKDFFSCIFGEPGGAIVYHPQPPAVCFGHQRTDIA